MPLWLSDTEVQQLTGRVQRQAQLRVLKELGYSVRYRPDGSFIVPTNQFFDGGSRAEQEWKMDFSGLGHGKKAQS